MNVLLVIRPMFFFQNCLIILRFNIQNAHRLNLRTISNMSDSVRYSAVPYASVSFLTRFSNATVCETKLVCEAVYIAKHALNHQVQ